MIPPDLTISLYHILVKVSYHSGLAAGGGGEGGEQARRRGGGQTRQAKTLGWRGLTVTWAPQGCTMSQVRASKTVTRRSPPSPSAHSQNLMLRSSSGPKVTDPGFRSGTNHTAAGPPHASRLTSLRFAFSVCSQAPRRTRIAHFTKLFVMLPNATM